MAKGGKRPGAGMPKGTKIKRTLEKERVLAGYRQRVMQHADSLFNAQYTKAIGSIQVFRIDEIDLGEGKTKKVHTLVTEPEEIKEVLDATANGERTEGVYFVTEILPDNKAIDSMLDRTFGKPQQSIEITDESNQKWKQAVQQLIAAKAAETPAEAVKLLKEAGFNPPSEAVEREVVNDIGQIG